MASAATFLLTYGPSIKQAIILNGTLNCTIENYLRDCPPGNPLVERNLQATLPAGRCAEESEAFEGKPKAARDLRARRRVEAKLARRVPTAARAFHALP